MKEQNELRCEDDSKEKVQRKEKSECHCEL